MNRLIKKFIAWPLVLIILLLVLLRITLSPLVETGISSWFKQQGMKSSIEDISFDISAGGMTLSKLVASRSGAPELVLERASLEWSWSSLLDSQVRLKSLALNGLSFNVERGPDDRLVIAGIELKKTATQEPADNADSEPITWSIILQQLVVNDFKLCYLALPRHDYCNQFDALTWTGEIGIDLEKLNEPSLPFDADGDFRLSKLNIFNNQLERRLLDFDDLSMQQVRITTPDDVEIQRISLEALNMFERAEKSGPAQITRLDKIQIGQLQLTQMAHLDIAEVKIQGHEVILINQANQKLEIDEWLQLLASKETKSADEATPGTAPQFTFAISKLEYQTSKSIEYQDKSLDKPFIIDLNSIELEIENLDSRNPEQKSRMHYSAKVAKHGLITIDGAITPLDAKPSFDLIGTIEGIDLRDLSSFTASTVGHNIKSGQLDATLKLKAEKNALASEMDITLNQFNFDALSTADKEKIDASFGFPLNASLSLLKDRDNRIKLKIPVTGDLQNPDFDPGDAIRQATSSAITAAVLNYYTPFGLVTLADGLFSLATALKFEPVEFTGGSSDISQVDNTGLEKISALMRDRPGIYVTLCAYTNSTDRKLLLPETAEIPLDELKLEEPQLAKLKVLGEARAVAIKNFLVDSQIDAARLVLCAPQHKEGEGPAGVEISI